MDSVNTARQLAKDYLWLKASDAEHLEAARNARAVLALKWERAVVEGNSAEAITQIRREHDEADAIVTFWADCLTIAKATNA